LELPYNEEPVVLLIGPYLNNSVTQQQILEQAERIGLPPGNIRELELFYSSLPVVREEHHLFAMVNTFAEYVFSGENNFSSVDLYFDRNAPALPDFVHNKTSESENWDAEVMEQRYQFENHLIDAVSQGNSHKAEQMMAGFSNLIFESRTSDQLRNLKNYCIIMNTLMRKAAERGGVHPVHLDRVSSDFARRIEAIRSQTGVTEFMLEMMRSYCRLVKRHSMQNYSPLVQKAMIRIEGDLTGDLSLTTVAAKNNVSPGYLSGLFKKETGQTFTAYVNGRRIALAKHLLKTTHLQVQTIAQHCGILDFHYFCRVFKNTVGTTPTAYRTRHVVGSSTM
jgi:AraC-like DNA-binding protein